MSQLTDFAENKLADMARGQAWTLPANLFVGFASAATDNAVTELSGSGYARAAAPRALGTWAGTQAVGSTLASLFGEHIRSDLSLADTEQMQMGAGVCGGCPRASAAGASGECCA